MHTVLERFSQFGNSCNKLQIQRDSKRAGKAYLFFPWYVWEMFASLKITVAFLSLQAALFLGLGVVFSLVSIPLVIYDWACSSSGDEGH